MKHPQRPDEFEHDDVIKAISHVPPERLDELKALSEKTHEPSNFAIDVFSRDLAHVLGLKNLSDAEVTSLVTEINAVFKSAGTSTVGFLDHVAKFKTALGTLGVLPADIAKLGGELETIGKQVRGPEDTPVDRGPARRR